jgi:hypothetical protein
MESSTRRIVSNEAGVQRTQTASGQFQRIFFWLRNAQKQSASASSIDFKLTDAQGRTYRSDFELRQVQPSGYSSEFSGASIAPGVSAHLNIDFDVAPDATGLVLHVDGGTDITVN